MCMTIVVVIARKKNSLSMIIKIGLVISVFLDREILLNDAR